MTGLNQVDWLSMEVVSPGLRDLHALGGPPPSERAHAFMVAIALQESRGTERYQLINGAIGAAGPARGFWQFECGGGVAGVLGHHLTQELAGKVTAHYRVRNNKYAVWRALEGNDLLACCFARLLIYSDPNPLPASQEEAWHYYLRTWRPGKPHPETWEDAWKRGLSAAKEVY